MSSTSKWKRLKFNNQKQCVDLTWNLLKLYENVIWETKKKN